MTTVLGIDPGGTTGIAWYDTEDPLNPDLQEVPGGTEGFTAFWREAYWTADAHAIVCESFRLDDRTEKPDLTPVEIIGFLKGTQEVTAFQTPAQAKSLITNAALKRAGLYPARGSVGGGHSTDALRHALAHLCAKRHLPTLRLLFPPEED